MEQSVIKLQVSNEYILGAGGSVGAVGSHDDVLLELDFRSSKHWDGTTRRATFANALCENLTPILLTTDLLEEGQTEIYLLPVPEEAKTAAGECYLSLEGFVTQDGKEVVRVSTEAVTFRVLPSKLYSGSDGSVTPTAEEQLQAEIDSIKQTVANAGISERNAKASEIAAKASEEHAAASETAAKSSENAAAASQMAAETASADATEAKNAAQAAAQQAAASTASAKTSEDNAAKSAAAAASAEATAAESQRVTTEARNDAVSAAADAAAAKKEAVSARDDAEDSATSASADALTARRAAAQADEKATAAAKSAADAQSARDAATASDKSAGDAAAEAGTQAAAAAESATGAANSAAAAAASSTKAQSAKADAERAKSSAETFSGVAIERADAAANSAAEAEYNQKTAESWAVGGTGTRSGEDTNNAKYWSSVAQGAASGGVSTFNGRSGAVVPQKGDYTPDMIGAAALDANGVVKLEQLPTDALDKTFYAVYGTTVADDLERAYQDGATIYCIRDNSIGYLANRTDASTFHFVCGRDMWTCADETWTATQMMADASHAATHGKGGSDAITPASIGAAELDENGKVPSAQIDSDIFFATYGKTKAAEISEALLAGKIAVAVKSGNLYPICFGNKSGNSFQFARFNYGTGTGIGTSVLDITADGWSVEDPRYFDPHTHARRHAKGGSDAITPEAIGAPALDGNGMVPMANLPFFVAKYGTTNADEIEAAYQAGRTILLVDADDGERGQLVARVNAGKFYFSVGQGYCGADDNGWTYLGGVPLCDPDTGLIPAAYLPETGYTKAQTLSDATKGKFNLGTESVPDDVLSYLGSYNQYMWRRTATTVNDLQMKTSALSGNNSPDIYWTDGSTTYNTVKASKNIYMDKTTGEIGLRDATTVTVAWEEFNGELTGGAATLKGQFIQGVKNTRDIYMVKSDATGVQPSSSGSYKYGRISTGSIGKVTYDLVRKTTEKTFLSSSDPDAYQNSITKDGATIQHKRITKTIDIRDNSTSAFYTYVSKSLVLQDGVCGMDVASATKVAFNVQNTFLGILGATPTYIAFSDTELSSGIITDNVFYLPSGTTGVMQLPGSGTTTYSIVNYTSGSYKYLRLNAYADTTVPVLQPYVKYNETKTGSIGRPFDNLERPNPIENIGTWTTSEKAVQVDLDLSSVDFSPYREVTLYITSPGDVITTDPAVRYNDDEASGRYYGNWTSNSRGYHRVMTSTGQEPWSTKMTFSNLGSSMMVSDWRSFRRSSSGGQFYYGTWSGGNLTALKKITLFNSESPTSVSFPAGLEFALLGVRK